MAAYLWSLLFSFKGRTRRSTWWAATCTVGLAFNVFTVFAETALFHNASLPLYPLFIWMLAALAVKRLHDTGKSVASLVWLLLPILGPLAILFRLGCRRGTEGENQYGADPFDVHFEYLQVNIQR